MEEVDLYDIMKMWVTELLEGLPASVVDEHGNLIVYRDRESRINKFKPRYHHMSDAIVFIYDDDDGEWHASLYKGEGSSEGKINEFRIDIKSPKELKECGKIIRSHMENFL